MSLTEIYTTYQIYLAILTIYCSGVIASAGGIGGGGVIMPLLLVVGGFPIHTAVILSQCAVFGNNFAQAYLNWSRAHPYNALRSLIYWEVVMILLPAQLGGSNIGVIISKIFPETILLILAIVTLVYAIYRTGLKGYGYYTKENEQRKHGDIIYQKLLHHSDGLHGGSSSSQQSDEEDDEEGGRVGINGNVQHKKSQSKRSLAHKSVTISGNSSSNPSHVGSNSEHGSDSHRLYSDDDHDIIHKQNVFSSLLLPTAEDEIEYGDGRISEIYAQSPYDSDPEDNMEQKRSSTRENRADTTDTVLVNPLTFSMTTSKNVANSLLISALSSSDIFIEEKEQLHQQALTNVVENNGNGGKVTHFPASKQPPQAPMIPNKEVTRVLPYRILTIIGSIWILYCMLFVVIQYTAKPCSLTYFLEQFSIYPVLILTIMYGVNFLYHRQQYSPRYRIIPGDIDFSKSSIAIPSSAFIVGILCSLLGIGGGELLGPLLLAFHVIPQVSTATTSMMSVLNSANNIVHYIILGDLNYPLAGTFILTGVLSGATGRSAALHFSQKYGRVSILVFMLTIILCCSVILLVYEIASKEFDWNLHEFC